LKGPTAILGLLGALVLILLLAHLCLFPYEDSTRGQILSEIFHGPSGKGGLNFVVWQLRLPRALECVFVGAILGAVGSAFQAQFRNPLADPYIVGVSSGAAVGGVLGFLLGLGEWLGGLGACACGFVCGMLSLVLVVALARRRGVVDVTSLLLAGVVVGSLLSSVLSMALLCAGQDTNQVLSWLLGNMTTAMWNKVALLATVSVFGTTLLVRQSRRMNALALGEEEARRLGVDANRLRNVILMVGTAMTAAAVGAVGIIGFLGLVAPHIARRVIGVDWRWSLPASALVGSSILIAADLIAQRGPSSLLHSPGLEIPVGIVTALLGAPTLLYLLRRAL
jgi:iron complex transport system permease protein